MAAAIELPRAGSDAEAPDIWQDDYRAIFQRFGSLPFNYSTECFDPIAVPAEEPVTADLADDLADIWRDVKAGLILYDQGERSAAGWQWVIQFSAHWGHHATAALYAIQSWFSQNGDDRLWD